MSEEKVQVLIHRLQHGSDLPLPAYQTESAVGVDLHAAVLDAVVVQPGRVEAIPTGFAIAVPRGYEGQIRPRSGLAALHGISIINSPGTIDSDYRGEIKVLLINLGVEAFTVTKGMRIAQMLVLPVPQIEWVEVEELPATPRLDGGFGHTGS